MEKPDDQNNSNAFKIKPLLQFIGAFVVALGLTWLIKEPGFTDSQVYVIFLLFFSIGLWVTEAIPAFAVGLFIMTYLVYTLGNKNLNQAPENIEKYVTTFSSSIIWLLLGGFFLARAMTKTGLDESILKLTLKFSGTKPRNIVVAVMFATMVISSLMSNTAATSMVVASLLPLLRVHGKSGLAKALLLGVSTAATVGGMSTIIGSPTNAIAAGSLEKAGMDISFLEWMKFGLPLSLVLTTISCLLLLFVFVKDNTPLYLDFILHKKEEADVAGSKSHRYVVLGVIVVTIFMWLTGDFHGISVAAVSAIPLVVLTLTRVLNNDDVKSMPWDTLLLVAGGLSLGVALQQTGLLEHYAILIKDMADRPIGFIILLAFATMTFSNVMSNSATSIILIPLGMAVLPGYEKEVAVIIGLAASTALFLPVSTPPNAVVYSTGLIKQKDFRITGLLIGLLGPILAILWVLLMR